VGKIWRLATTGQEQSGRDGAPRRPPPDSPVPPANRGTAPAGTSQRNCPCQQDHRNRFPSAFCILHSAFPPVALPQAVAGRRHLPREIVPQNNSPSAPAAGGERDQGWGEGGRFFIQHSAFIIPAAGG